jgi:anti-sigma regulatory factor (Ser/Thr protein kinase)
MQTAARDERRKGDVLARPDGVLVLSRHSSAAERGRRHVAAVCRGFDEDFVLTAALLTSELITNALEHGSGDIDVLVSPISAGVRVDVADTSPLEPVRRTPGHDDEGGRGLLIVESLATVWGMEPLPQGGGKTVWFVLLAEG